MATKFINPEVPYLKPECLLEHTNVVLTCSDGVKLRTSKLVLAAHSPLMRRVLLDCTEDSKATFNVESASATVLLLLQFMHTGEWEESGEGVILSIINFYVQ